MFPVRDVTPAETDAFSERVCVLLLTILYFIRVNPSNGTMAVVLVNAVKEIVKTSNLCSSSPGGTFSSFPLVHSF